MNYIIMADTFSGVTVMRGFVAPVARTLCVLASLVCVFFLVNGGIAYITSTGKPTSTEHAKRIIRNALLGLVIVLAAGALTIILEHSYTAPSVVAHAGLPNLTAVKPQPVSNGLVGVLLKAITGLLNNIIQAMAAPFLKALSFFTTSTPLMVNNSAVFKLWVAMTGIADGLLVLVIMLLGFRVMSSATFGFTDLDIKQMLPRICLIFLLLNTSIFAIDGIIELSNVMIHAVNAASGGASVWAVLTEVAKQSGGQGIAALLIMIAFLILSAMLLVYYVGRLVILYIGAVLSPVVVLLWLVPGFRDFAQTTARSYCVTVFVLFVHVVILQVAASLFTGMAAGNSAQLPDMLMAMITGIATLMVLLKTQGVMTQFSYVSVGPRTARLLGSQFLNGVSYINSSYRQYRPASISTLGYAKTSNRAGESSKPSHGVTQKPSYKQSANTLSSMSSVHKKAMKGRLVTKDTIKPEPPKIGKKP